MKSTETFNATIYIGLKEGYDGKQHSIGEVYEIIQEYCDSVGFCVSVTETKYIYSNGNENGVIVGLINYPRFESTPHKILQKAIEIGDILMIAFKQNRYTIVCPERTYLREKFELEENGNQNHQISI